MKTFVSNIIATVASLINASAIIFIASMLFSSELTNLPHFTEMANPSSGWYYYHPSTWLFAYKAPQILFVYVILTCISAIFTFIYIKLKKSGMDISDMEDFSSKTAMLTFGNVLSLASLTVTAILGIALYRVFPMSIVYIVLTCAAVYFVPMKNVISKI